MPDPAAAKPATPATNPATRAPSQSAITPGIRELAHMRISATVGQLVAIMLRQTQYRHAFLCDLEWLVMPAIVTGQYAMRDAVDKQSGVTLPAAAVLWAMVSPEVDARLTANPGTRPHLKPDEWKSGTIPWLVDAIGEPQSAGLLVNALVDKQFKASGLKTYRRGQDGKITVGVLRAGEKTNRAGDEKPQAQPATIRDSEKKT